MQNGEENQGYSRKQNQELVKISRATYLKHEKQILDYGRVVTRNNSKAAKKRKMWEIYGLVPLALQSKIYDADFGASDKEQSRLSSDCYAVQSSACA